MFVLDGVDGSREWKDDAQLRVLCRVAVCCVDDALNTGEQTLGLVERCVSLVEVEREPVDCFDARERSAIAIERGEREACNTTFVADDFGMLNERIDELTPGVFPASAAGK
jgi:hypothetical protein